MKIDIRRKNQKRKSVYRCSTDKIRLYSLCIPSFFLVFVFSYLPMFGIVIAFKDYNYNLGILNSKWVGLKNFEFFTTSSSFWVLVRNTLGLNFLFIIFGTLAAIAIAILLFELKSRVCTKAFQTVMITPTFLSWVVAAYMAYAFLNPEYGFINKVLLKLGMNKVDFYTQPNAWPAILTIASVWKSVGINSVMYYAGLMAIDTTLYEAAKIDGANKWQQIRSITIPGISALIIMLTILSIGGIFRADFGLFYQLTRNVGALYPTTDVVDTYIFRTMRSVGDMGMSAAVGLLQSVVGLIMVLLTNHIVKKIQSDAALF